MSISLSKKRESILKRIKEYTLFADEFMSKVFEDKECAQYLLRVIMKMPALVVLEIQTQYDIRNLSGRAIRLDIYCKNSEGKLINVEIQRQDVGAGAKRARYHSSLIDANILDKGQDHDDLPETYVIFVTEHDIWDKGLPLYHIDRVVKEASEDFGDEAHIIYVNGTYRGNDDIGNLMHDFSCSNPDDMISGLLADRARFLKMTQEGVDIMSKSTEEMFRGWLLDEKKDDIKKLLSRNKMTKEEIAEDLNVDISVVEEVEASMLQMV